MKHKHYDCIVAWAGGAEIEVLQDSGEWVGIETPYWHPDNKYRIKKYPLIEEVYIQLNSDFTYIIFDVKPEKFSIKITYQDGYAIKAEVAK